MQISMKATESELVILRQDIASARVRTGLSNAEIGRLARVDPSNVSRIVRGEFMTISGNVVQICKTLGLQVDRVASPAGTADVAWSKLEASVRRLWDETPQGADRIVALLDTVADLH